jgi:hypothetical protein
MAERRDHVERPLASMRSILKDFLFLRAAFCNIFSVISMLRTARLCGPGTTASNVCREFYYILRTILVTMWRNNPGLDILAEDEHPLARSRQRLGRILVSLSLYCIDASAFVAS